jgi:hypothetical protein
MVATLNDVPFDVDPSSVSWDYRIHTSDAPYLGGKVIQVFGSSIGDITVSGSFRGPRPIEAQDAFLKRMKALGNAQLNDLRNTIRFQWPEQRWDMQCYLMSYTNPDGADSIVYAPEIFAPKWTLQLFPITGTDQLKTAAVSNFIDRLSAGIGWRPGKYNGGSAADVQQALSASGTSNLSDYVKRAFGITQSTAGQTASSVPLAAPNATSTSGATLTSSEAIVLASKTGFVGQDLRIAVAIAKAESGLYPRAANRVPPDNSFGLWQINMLAHGTRFGSEDELYNPDRNAAAAFALYTGRGGHFSDWTTYTNGKYLSFLSEMDAAATALRL